MTKNKHFYSTLLLIIIIFVTIVFVLTSAITSEELDEVCDQDHRVMLRNGEWGCYDPYNITGNLTVNGLLNNVQPHMYGIATEQQLAVSTGVWYNVTFNNSLGDIENMTFNNNNDTLYIIFDGHYSITFGVSIIDVAASPNANVAMRIVVNGLEVPGSYFEVTTTKQNSIQYLEHSTHVYLLSGDVVNMQWVTSSTSASINSLGTYSSGTNGVAYGFIIRDSV